MKISLSETSFFDKKDFTGNVYVGKDKRMAFNALLVDCIVGHYKTKLSRATRVYLVMAGHGTFTINEAKHTAEEYDLFIINADDTYEYNGAMKLFEFNIPATDESNEEKIQ